MAVHGGPDIITDGLVLSLDAADKNSYPGSGTTWYDLSGKGNDGTLTNGPTFSSTAGGGTIVFDGSNDYVSLPSQNDAQSVLSGWGNMTGADTNNYSIELWVKTSQSEGSTGVNSPGLVSRDNGDLYCNLTCYNGIVYFVHYNGSWVYTPASTTDISDNVWHHVAFVNHSNETGDIYIDGVKEASGVSTSIVGSNYFSPDNLGRGYLSKYFNGEISTFSAYDRALSAKEISQNFNAKRSRFSV